MEESNYWTRSAHGNDNLVAGPSRRRANASRISWACRSSNAAIAEPVREVLLAPATVLFGRVERAVGRIVHDGLVDLDKGVPHSLLERALAYARDEGVSLVAAPFTSNVISSAS